MIRLLAYISCGGLLFLGSFRRIFAFTPWKTEQYIFGFNDNWKFYLLSLMLAPIIVGALLYLFSYITSRNRSPFMKELLSDIFIMLSGYGAICLIALIMMESRDLFVAIYGHGNSSLVVIVVFAVLLIALLFIVLRSRKARVNLEKWFVKAMLVISPFILLCEAGTAYVLVSTWNHLQTPQSLTTSTNINTVQVNLPKTVVVMVADSLSYDFIFEQGNIKAELPNLQALTQASIVFHRAFGFPGDTLNNLPAVLTGHSPVISGAPAGFTMTEEGLFVPFVEGPASSETLFDLAHRYGYRTSVIGISTVDYYRYGAQPGYVDSQSFANSSPPDIQSALLNPYFDIIRTAIPFSVRDAFTLLRNNFLVSITDSNDIAGRTQIQREELLTQLSVADGAFYFIHYLIPHNPMEINAKTGRLIPTWSYTESVKTVDSLIGEIKNKINQSSSWDDTLFILLADHIRATEPAIQGVDYRIPLIIKLPHSNSSQSFDQLWVHTDFMPLLQRMFNEKLFSNEGVIFALNSQETK